PTVALTTQPASACVAASTKPAPPHAMRGALTPRSRNSARKASAHSSVSTETNSGACRAICSASFATLCPAASATTRKGAPSASTTRKVLQPIEPVEPKMATPQFFICARSLRGSLLVDILVEHGGDLVLRERAGQT